jgi:hypothetical protein
LTRGSIRSTGFNVIFDGEINLARIIDSPITTTNDIGTLRLVSIDGETIFESNYGTVDYRTGSLTIPNFYFVGYSGGATDVRINANPVNLDLEATNNQILVLDNSLQSTPVRREAGLTISTFGE